MSDDNASFEVELRDKTSRNAKKVAAAFGDLHRAASGSSKGLAAADMQLTKVSKKSTKAAKGISSAFEAIKKNSSVDPLLVRNQQGHFDAMAESARKLKKNEDDAYDAQRKREFQATKARRAQAVARREQAQTQRLADFRTRKQHMGDMGGDISGMVAAPAMLGAAAGAYAAFETGKATLSAVKFRDESLMGLKLITGSASEANRVFEDSVMLSDKLGQDWRTTVGGMQKLLGKGFEEDFAKDMTRGLADLSIVAPDANVGNLLLAIGQIKNANKLQGDELNQLTEAGLNSNLMFNVLQEKLGKSREEVLKLKEAGKLMADDVLPAILTSIQRLTGKELGMAAEEATDTVAGTMRRLEQLPGRFFLGVANELDKSNLDGSLKGLLDALDPQSDAFAAGVKNVAEAVKFGAEALDVAIPLAKEFGGAFADSFAAFMGLEPNEDFFAMWRDPETLAAIREWGTIMGRTAGAIAKIMELIARFGPATAEVGLAAHEGLLAGGISGSMVGVATNIVEGFVQRLWGGAGEARAAGAGLGQAAIDGARSKDGVDAHSPSRKAFQLGAYTAQGISLGMDKWTPKVERTGESAGSAAISGIRSSSSSLPDVNRGSAVSAKASASSMQIGDVSIALSNLPEDATKNPEALARAIRRELQSLFDGIVQQGTIQVDA